MKLFRHKEHGFEVLALSHDEQKELGYEGDGQKDGLLYTFTAIYKAGMLDDYELIKDSVGKDSVTEETIPLNEFSKWAILDLRTKSLEMALSCSEKGQDVFIKANNFFKYLTDGI